MGSPSERARRREGSGFERVACAIGLILQSLALAGFVFWEGLLGDYPGLLLTVMFIAIPLAIFGAAAVLVEPGDQTAFGRSAKYLLIAQAAMQVLIISVLVYRVAENLVEAEAFGIDARLDAVRLGLATIGVLLLASVLRTMA